MWEHQENRHYGVGGGGLKGQGKKKGQQKATKTRKRKQVEVLERKYEKGKQTNSGIKAGCTKKGGRRKKHVK